VRPHASRVSGILARAAECALENTLVVSETTSGVQNTGVSLQHSERTAIEQLGQLAAAITVPRPNETPAVTPAGRAPTTTGSRKRLQGQCHENPPAGVVIKVVDLTADEPPPRAPTAIEAEQQPCQGGIGVRVSRRQRHTRRASSPIPSDARALLSHAIDEVMRFQSEPEDHPIALAYTRGVELTHNGDYEGQTGERTS